MLSLWELKKVGLRLRMIDDKTKKDGVKLIVVRVRGGIKLKKPVKDTFKFLNLHKKNHCVIVPNTPNVRGLLQKINRYITWGEVSSETLELLKKRHKGKKFFALNPPKKGYGRKGVKIPFSLGGALGYRKDKINDLVKRLI